MSGGPSVASRGLKEILAAVKARKYGKTDEKGSSASIHQFICC